MNAERRTRTGALAPAIGIVVALAALTTASTPASAQVLARSIFANAVGSASGGGMVLHGALGQSTTGGSADLSNQTCAGFWCVPGFPVVAVEPLPPGDSGNRLRFAFGPPMPNPTRGAVQFDLELPAAGRVRLEAFDVTGRRVGDVFDRAFDAGRIRLAWDGARAGAGVYFVRLSLDGVSRGERRVVIVP